MKLDKRTRINFAFFTGLMLLVVGVIINNLYFLGFGLALVAIILLLGERQFKLKSLWGIFELEVLEKENKK